MRSASSVAWAAGPMVVAAYLASAVATTWFRSHVAEVSVAIGASAAGFYAARIIAPGTVVSTVAFESVQVLLVWESMALWCGAAAVLGAAAPITTMFKGSSGAAAAGAVAATFAPGVLLAALGAAAAGLAVFRGRHRDAAAVGLCAAPAYAWVAWAADLQPLWGVTNGPELALWTAAVSSILLARWWAPASRSEPRSDPAPP